MPSTSKKQAKTMSAACKSPEFRKKVDIPKKVACDFHSADKGKYHKEDIEMNEELDRIKKLAGMPSKEEVSEKIELTASDEHTPKDAKASDVSQAMNMARLKKTVEDRDADDTDFTGLFTGVARGEISLDDNGKIAESTFGIIKELDDAVAIKLQKKVEEANYNFHKGGVIFGKNGEPDEEIESYSNEPKAKKKKDSPDMSAYAAANKKKSVAEEAEEVDEMASDEKKAGRKAAGSYGRPGSKEQKRAASKSARKSGKSKSNEIDEYGDSHMFEKDSLSRIMVEMIFTEMKKGKNSKEISEELSFAYEGVRKIVEVLKKKVSKVTEMARPRGGPHIENVDYWDKPDEHLLYIIKDAGEAAKALRGHDLRAEGKYLDQVNDASTVLYARRQQAGVQEQGLPGYDAWKTASPYDNEPSESDVEHAHEIGGDYGMNYLHDDTIAQAMVADLKNPATDPEDRKGLWPDLISDVVGTIVNGLENDGIMVLSDDEVNALALVIVKKHMMQHVN